MGIGQNTRREFMRALGAGAAALAAPPLETAAGTAPAADPPNVVIVLADDLGYQDLTCYGSSRNRTPHIDRMAAEGVRFTSFYATSGVCTPSRASLLTGCYPRRVSMHEDEAGEWVLFPVSRKGLNPSELTLPKLLKTRGYSTHLVGKWHLGDQPAFLPRHHGFDHYFGIPYSNDMGEQQRPGNPPLPLLVDDTVVEAPVDLDTLTERYTQEAVQIVSESRSRPFFLLLSHFVPHTPLRAGVRFRGKSANGLYGDSVEELDSSTGTVLAALERHGLADNTLVVFTSDNGGVREVNNGPLAGTKGSTMEGGMRVPFIARWPRGGLVAGRICAELASMMDLLPTLAALAEAPLPRDHVIDGKNILALLRDPERRRTPYDAFLYYYMGQLQAVRAGRWKLHLPLASKRHGWHRPPYEERGQLYDLDSDVSERVNLFDARPDVVSRLSALAAAAAADIGNEDRDGRRQRPAGWVERARPLTLVRSGQRP